ncbi:hypothetical protein GUJ93_ZPchr0008g13859 [Zizania palustris]|uniref:Uncharacterized protein n=1 Tax=Zizania palustris TaxID=103762 RepID=A0A8J5RJ15_ZIZPA|nr:hypothetical protein GUJ93_ZPchr0008g13859 [Zizania palustris]
MGECEATGGRRQPEVGRDKIHDPRRWWSDCFQAVMPLGWWTCHRWNGALKKMSSLFINLHNIILFCYCASPPIHVIQLLFTFEDHNHVTGISYDDMAWILGPTARASCLLLYLTRQIGIMYSFVDRLVQRKKVPEDTLN